MERDERRNRKRNNILKIFETYIFIIEKFFY